MNRLIAMMGCVLPKTWLGVLDDFRNWLIAAA